MRFRFCQYSKQLPVFLRFLALFVIVGAEQSRANRLRLAVSFRNVVINA
jgi:hypothetical protein